MWTDDQISFVKDNYTTMTALEIADTLGKTRSQVKNRCRKLGLIKQENLPDPWQDWEIDILRNNYEVMSYSELSELLPNRTTKAISTFCSRHRLIRERKVLGEEEIDFIIEHKESMTNIQMSEILGVTESALECFRHKHNIKTINWTTEEEETLKQLYKSKTGPELSLLMQRPKMCIYEKAKRLGLDKKGIFYTKYTHNKKTFSNVNQESAYWAGVLAADGSISSTRGVLTLSLKKADEEHIFKFKNFLQYTGPVYHGFAKIKDKQYPKTWLGVNSAWNLIEDLKTYYNITSRKSLTLQPPNITDINCLKSFFVGYIDGDGSILIPKDKPSIKLSAVGNYDFLKFMKACFEDWYDLSLINSKRKCSDVTKDHSIFNYAIHGSRARVVLEDLLKMDLPFLPRKWDVARQFIGMELNLLPGR